MISFLVAPQRWERGRLTAGFGFGSWRQLGALAGVGWTGAPLRDVDLAGVEID
jgi:hypothetical protein